MYAICPNKNILEQLKNIITHDLATIMFVSYDRDLTQSVIQYLDKIDDNNLIIQEMMYCHSKIKLKRDTLNSLFQIIIIDDMFWTDIVLPCWITLSNIINSVNSSNNQLEYPYNFIFIEGIVNGDKEKKELLEYHDKYFNDDILIEIRTFFNNNII